jgi:ligand-binding sensor domain-containing protein
LNRVLRLFFLCIIIPTSGIAQFNLFRNFNVKDGLPSSEVYEMLQESTGYFWFPTDMGVSRFNGYEFKNYTTEDGLPDNTVFGVHEDYKHRIWFRSSSGKLSYFSKEKIFTIPANDELAVLLKGTIVTSLYVDKGDTIWMGTADLFILKIEPGWKAHHIKKIIMPQEGQYIYEVNADGFIYGGYSALKFIYVMQAGKLSWSIPVDTTHPIVGGRMRFQVKRLIDNSYLVSIHDVMVNFNKQGIIFKKQENQMIICVAEDEDKSILAGTYLGLKLIWDGIESSNPVFKKLDQKTITALHRDKENELWICTKGHGIFYIPYRNFRYYTPENGLPESSIACIGILGDKVTVGHLNGQISVFENNAIKTIQLAPLLASINSVSEVTGFLNFNKTKKYIGTIQGIYELTANNFKERNQQGTKKIIELKDKSILSLRFRSLTQYDSLFAFKKSLVYGLPYYSDNIYEDRNGTIWICSSNGLYTYTKTDSLQYAGTKDTLLKNRIVDLADGADNSLWMVSRGEGVIIKMGKDFFQIKKKDGLSSNMCRVLYMDSANTVWVGTNNGLNKITVSSYHPFRYTIENYYSNNGLLTNEVNGILKYKNKIWLAHNNGISVFDPDRIKDNTTPPPVYITRVLINGENAETKNRQSLNYSENYVDIQYNGLSYKEPGKIEYKYKLEGLDTNWTYAANTSVKFQTLPSGTYRFIVYAKNNDGYLSSSPATFTFTIQPPWWQTWVFRISMTGLIIFLVTITFKLRIDIIVRRAKLKTIQRTRLSTAELKALRAQMNPHFVFNAINSVQYFITNNDPKSSQKYLSKFAKLIRYVVDNSKPAAIPLNKELEALRLYLDLESLRFKNKFEYTINVNSKVDVDAIQIPSMLIQPYVENAIWHGLMHKKTGQGKLTIQLDLKKNVLLCAIEDNGIGRKKSAEIRHLQHNETHKSVGMSITKERLDIFNQINHSNLTVRIIDLEDELGFGIGTRVELKIPSY